MRPMPKNQRGVTLIVTLIMLVLITLLAVSSFKLGKSSLQVVGNMQNRNEAIAAAQETLEQAISTTRLFENPAAVIPASTNPDGTACPVNTKCVDVNGDGSTDIRVTLTAPACRKIQPIENAKLDVSKTEDVACAVGVAQSLGMLGTTSGASLCADSMWELKADATDVLSQATVTVTEGVAVRVSTDNAASTCP